MRHQAITTLISTFLAGTVAKTTFSLPTLPSLAAGPKTLPGPLPSSAPREPSRICVVDPDAADAGPALISAAQDCNNGGTVVLLPDTTYTIASPTDLTFLQSIDILILGTVVFSDDVEYWQTRAYGYAYQDTHLFWRFGGKDVNIYGLGVGTLDGLGQTWWTAKRSNETVYRPVLFGTDGLFGGSISGLNMKDSPMWFNIIMNSSDVLITDINIWNEVTNSSSPPANTDGWDTYRSTNIVIQNSTIDNYDDCVSFKPNSTNIIVQNLQCNGSHGVSVGSLGQYQGEYDIVEDVYVYNISMSNASDGARIKIWPGVPPNTTGSSSGGGAGYVRNITYELFHNVNNDWAIQLTQCYFASSQEACNAYPAVLQVEDVLFKDFSGTTSKRHDPQVGSLVCSDPSVCKNIRAENIAVSPPSTKTAQWICTNMDEELLDINCVAAASA
ncbi:putative glycoside hydrolase family 28 protein [Rosellinia necatrix]|uniref:galacturonan 1,4-alpha-galacturonidase n=1 Tax=Rosellinia necatrix TaxID=77044 RepID=A0A1S7UII1_ROSNE|nr:putative glycoside hydrolase family 28 protein [Rosellinia necatrix]